MTEEAIARTRSTIVSSPIGDILLTGDGRALTGLYMSPHRGRPAVRYEARDEADDRLFDDVISQLDSYFAGEREVFDVSLRPVGTPFQLRVWAELSRIPYGETISYGELARRVGSPNGFRAVGQANGRNPISVIVPCHRVIGADGSLAGYGGGADRKRFLLDLEGASRRLV
ncbi:MAG: methylated-DNA--[protein]-cysteine S-methyltransferase [Actinomycetota bacterium]|nr:methylated-DNA--[protein]-cysteine S-methyltransferase [Actinomycetota bacterium]